MSVRVRFANAEVSLAHSLARPGAEGWTRGEGTGAHAEARAERRRNIAQEVAAARATAFCAERSGSIGAEPVTAGIAQRIDTLHRETGHILHFLSPRRRKAQISFEARQLSVATKTLSSPGNEKTQRKRPGNIPRKNAARAKVMAGIVPRAACGVKHKGYKILRWSCCGEVERRDKEVRRFSLTIRKPSY